MCPPLLSKMRSLGSLVYADEPVIFRSVKHENFTLGASPPHAAPAAVPLPSEGAMPSSAKRASIEAMVASTDEGPTISELRTLTSGDCSERPEFSLRLPSVLKNTTAGEVNGNMTERSLTVKLYLEKNGKTREEGALMTGLNVFRLFHPEGNGETSHPARRASGFATFPRRLILFVLLCLARCTRAGFIQASSNPDKGEVLDSLPGEAARFGRAHGCLPHVPYLKTLPAGVDSINPLHLSAKGCWCFEALDPRQCIEATWRQPMRLKHIPSGKYLSVDSTRVATFPEAIREEIGGREAPSPPVEGGGEAVLTSTMYDAALVAGLDPDAAPGSFGSAASMEFMVTPMDKVGTTLKSCVTVVRLEHRSLAAGTLYFVAPPGQTKPPMVDAGSKGGAARGCGGARQGSALLSALGKQPGQRLCFGTERTELDVLKIQPLLDEDTSQLKRILSHIPLLKKYAFGFHAAADPAYRQQPPVSLCEALAVQCMNIIDELRKGVPPPRRNNGSVSDSMKEANEVMPAVFSSFFGGEPDLFVQKLCVDVKLLDALFEAALSPYNYSKQALQSSRPFDDPLLKVLPKAIQKFLYVAVQRSLAGNVRSQEYFAKRKSRVWRLVNGGNLSADVIVEDWQEEEAAAAIETQGADMRSEAQFTVRRPMDMGSRGWDLWRNILISQGEDSLGGTVTLGQLLEASGAIVKQLVNNELLERFKGLVMKCGPELRLINLFKAICKVEGTPSRANQEMCVRKLYMVPRDRYNFGASIAERPDIQQPKLKKSTELGFDPDVPRMRAPKTAPHAYLGRSESNSYAPVIVEWSGTQPWTANCGHLWWSAVSMGIPLVEPSKRLDGVSGSVDAVAIEHLMWVLDPQKFCKAVSGNHWRPFLTAKKPTRRAEERDLFVMATSLDMKEKARKQRFERQHQLASYVVAQMELYTSMCTGR